MAPGSAIDEQKLATQLEMADAPIREALKLLAHDDLVTITPRRGLHVARVSLPGLEQISEMRAPLEALAARAWPRGEPRLTTWSCSMPYARGLACCSPPPPGSSTLIKSFIRPSLAPPTTATWLAPSIISLGCRSGFGILPFLALISFRLPSAITWIWPSVHVRPNARGRSWGGMWRGSMRG